MGGRILLALFLGALSLAPANAAPVSFNNEVMAVMSRAGCNSGACHGNLNGKGGFKLSLRGENPEADYLALTRDLLGRRINPEQPARSLLLQKATMQQPHEGGQRFSASSPEYALLKKWIAQGTRRDPRGTRRPVSLSVTPRSAILTSPANKLSVRVLATFSDRTTRDVTSLAVFEPSNLLARVDSSGTIHRLGDGETTILVRYLDTRAVVRLAFIPARPDFKWKETPEVNFIDKHVFAKLRTLRMQPSELASDSVFLRRAYLDTLGILPTPAESRRFLADTAATKREKLIDALLKRPEFADFWALKWSDLLRNEEKTLDRRGVKLFHGWIRQAIVDRTPLNQFAKDLVAGRGSTYTHPAANYYRALRDPQTRAEATAQVFLGIRLQCAKCHNHPFDQWTQTDYHRWAAFFARVKYRIVENNRRDRLDSHEFAGEQVVYMDRATELKHPVDGSVLVPKLLGSGAKVKATSDRLLQLSAWIAAPDNPFFARAQANRIWQHLLGRGIVDPIDDFRESNPPVNEALLDDLAKDLVKHKFDLRHLVKRIMMSRVYQLSAVPTSTNRDDETNFARAIVRPLQAEQLLDAVGLVTGSRARLAGLPKGMRAGQMPGVARPSRGRTTGETERFLSIFGKPVRSLSCECERSEATTLAQAFQLITGAVLNKMLAEKNNRLGKLIDAGKSDAAIVEEVYLAALCRKPSEAERKATLGLVRRSADRRSALEDVLWGVVNSKEFLLRR